MMASGPAVAAPSAQAEALGRTTHSDLLRALRGLPDEFRAAVYLADIEGYPYREIAEIMGTPVETVMSRLHRGRLRILEQLTAGGEHATRKRPGLDLGPGVLADQNGWSGAGSNRRHSSAFQAWGRPSRGDPPGVLPHRGARVLSWFPRFGGIWRTVAYQEAFLVTNPSLDVARADVRLPGGAAVRRSAIPRPSRNLGIR
jgi:hypothetical protein